MEIVRITGASAHVPDQVLSNADVSHLADPGRLAEFVGSNAWCLRAREPVAARIGRPVTAPETARAVYEAFVEERMGIRERRVVNREAILAGRASATGAGSSDLGVHAARSALDRAGVDASAIDLVVCGSSTPDRAYPAMAVRIQDQVGARGAFGFDVLAACTSLLYAAVVARGQILAGTADRVLVVAAEHFTAGVDYRDPYSSFYWGDAAAALVVESAACAGAKPGLDVLDARCASRYSENIRTTLGGIRSFRLLDAAHGGEHRSAHDGPPPGHADYPYFFQDGPRVFRDVVPMVADGVLGLLAKHGVAPDAVRRLFLHQASRVIVDGISTRVLGEDAAPERVPTNFGRFGNTSSCGVGICLAEERGLRTGDLAVAAAFGAGYTWGALLLRQT